MNRPTSRGLAACSLAFVLLAPAILSADTVTYCDSFPRQTLRDFTLNVRPYDKQPCILLDADVVLDIVVDGKFFGENRGNCLPAGCSEYDSTHVSLSFQNLDATAAGSQFDRAEHRTLTSNDGVFDFGGTSGYTSPYTWPAYVFYNVPYANLVQFLGPQSVSVDTNAFWYRTGPGNGSYGVSTYVRATLCVTYTYQCAVGAAASTWGDVKVLSGSPHTRTPCRRDGLSASQCTGRPSPFRSNDKSPILACAPAARQFVDTAIPRSPR